MNNDVRKLLAGYVDGELTDEERKTVEHALLENEELRVELEEFQKLKEVTGMAQYADLPEEVWESYWESLYKKMERGLGWILLSLGAIIIFCFGAYTIFSELFTDPSAPLWLKIGLPTMSAGVIILLVSFVRQRLFAYKRDRYGRIKR